MDFTPPGIRGANLSEFARNVTYNGIEGIYFQIARVKRRGETFPSSTEERENPTPLARSLPEAGDAPEVLQDHVAQARQWLTHCFVNHDSCHKTPRFSRIYGGGSSHDIIDLDSESAMPTRLLRITKDIVQLVHVHDTIGYAEYVCLSHRWGPDERCKTLQSNVDEIMNGLKISNLPTTFREAAEFTKALGYSYIWIDSLCIIQDSAEDWANEAPRMACIYGNSVCSITALDAATSDGGLFPAVVPTSGSLETRGWYLQERMISPRSIIFSNGSLNWECRQSSPKIAPKSDTGSTLSVSSHPKQFYAFLRDFELPSIEITYSSDKCTVFLDDVQQLVPHRDYEPFLKAWWELIPLYTSLTLTRPSDKLVALSGITNTVLRNIHLRNYQGLWGGNFLLYELTWYVDPGGPEGDGGFEGRMDMRPLAPSWSWANLTSGRICNDQAFREPPNLVCKPWIITPIETSFEHALPYESWNWLSSLSVDMKAHLRVGTVTKTNGHDGAAPRYETYVEPTGHYSDLPENERFDFRPDVAANFPFDQPIPVTCAHLYHYKKEHGNRSEHIDVLLVLQQMKIRDNEQANVYEEDEYVTFDFEGHRWNDSFHISFPANFYPDQAQDEAEMNARTFRRVGYLEARYVNRRDLEVAHEDRWWKIFRMI